MASTAIRLRTPLFERALLAHLPELQGRALKLCRRADEASDLVQDCLERALRFATQYADGTNLRAWLHQILYSVFVSRYRRRRREKAALVALTPDPCAWTLPEAQASPDGALPLLPGCSKVFGQLPTAYQEVLWLVDVREWTYRDAATALELPLGTVMSRLHRARRMLAERWPDPHSPLRGRGTQSTSLTAAA
jgi:RNA polymerase sigma-70 factor (ECF subfamily)